MNFRAGWEYWLAAIGQRVPRSYDWSRFRTVFIANSYYVLQWHTLKRAGNRSDFAPSQKESILSSGDTDNRGLSGDRFGDPDARRRPTEATHFVWIHSASYTYRLDPPEKPLEAVWIAHPGWGYIRRRDLWVRRECPAETLRSQGYVELKPGDDEVTRCPYCGMHISSIPGALVRKHMAECGGQGENWLEIEDALIDDQRRKDFAAKLEAERLREQAEQEAMEKKERFDRIREDYLARQLQKDRKKRIKQETREDLRNR